MKVLRLQAYCHPEKVASAHLVADMLAEFAKENITTIIHVPVPSRGIDATTQKVYRKIKHEQLCDGAVQIHRFAMFREGRNPIQRALRYLLCNIIQYWKSVCERDIDVVYGSSTPPTQGLLCGLVKKRLCKKYGRYVPFVYNLQDVFPDSLVTTGLTKKGSLLWKLGRKIEDFTYNNADKIIVISQSMKRNIMAKGVPEEKVEVISNWIDAELVQPVAKEDNRLFEEFGIDREKFTVVYAGNFGAAQGADVVLEAAKLLPDVQFVIFGGGAEFESAKQKAETLPNVIINGLLPQERVPEVYSLGDVCLITCKKGVGTSGMPSKTWSIMACNTPIIAAFDTDSDLAEVIAQAKVGVCVEPEAPEALADAIKAFAEEGTAPYKNNGRSYVMTHADKKNCTGRYVEVLRSCLK